MSKAIKIVAFGDSLTRGTQTPTAENPFGKETPYGEFLQEFLGAKGEVTISGINGELTEGMISRVDRDVISLRPDYVIILGGTNDLGWGVNPREIYRNLVTLYERARVVGITPIGVTVPSIRGFDDMIPPRQILNRLIIGYCRNQPQPGIDLFTETAEPETLRLADRYSNDGLHLTTEGYRRMAECLSREVFSHL